MSPVPTEGDEYAKLTYHLRMAQEAAAMVAHLHNANDARDRAKQWLQISEGLKKFINHVTQLAMGRMQ
jgi:hypothetical protein